MLGDLLASSMPQTDAPTFPRPELPARGENRRRAGALAGVEFFAWFATVIGVMAATGRVASATYRRPQSDGIGVWYAAAIWRDVVEALPYLAIVSAPMWLGLGLVTAGRRGGLTGAGPRRLLQALLGIVALVTWLAAVSFAEFQIERGSLPVWHDMMGGMDAAFVTSSLGNVVYLRYLLPGVVAWLLIGVALVAFGRRCAARPPAPSTWSFVLAFVTSCTIFSLATHPVHAPRVPLPRMLVKTQGVTSPFGRFFGSAAVALTGGATEPRQILAEASLPAALAPEGAHLLGLPFQDTSRACQPHPWAAPLDEPSTGDPSSIKEGMRRIGEALWAEGRGAPKELLLFQISLESFRAADLTALNPAAPRGLAPFMNGLYEAARKGSRSVLAAGNLWQGGVRTSQGLSAFTCGLGALPHGISLVRDLGDVPLRCLSDVLVDAGFEATFAYGSHARFDNMDTFLGFHGFRHWLTQDTLPRGLPLGEWDAVTDRALMAHTLTSLAKAPPRPGLVLLMTLSNHSPFQAPQDLPPDVEARVAHALAERPNLARREDHRRLVTYAYSDVAVQEFFARLDATGLSSRSIVVLHADHATGERFVWPLPNGKEGKTNEAKGRIPFVVVFPEALTAQAADPESLRTALRTTQQSFATQPVSLNDVPRWLLALLAAHPDVRRLPSPWRWHTLGGMTASPHFSFPGRQAPRLFGINGLNQLFFLGAEGALVGQLEDVMALSHPEELHTATQPLFPATVLWSGFLTGHAQRCPEPRHIRMRP